MTMATNNGFNTRCMCGAFETPVHPDLGKCHPYRLKLDCVPPTIPVSPCDDENITVEYDPNLSPPFRLVAGTFDTNCLEILDTSGIPVTGPLT